MKIQRSLTFIERVSTNSIYDFIHITEQANCDIHIFYEQQDQSKRPFIDFTTLLLSIKRGDRIVIAANGPEAGTVIDELCLLFSESTLLDTETYYIQPSIGKGDDYETRFYHSE